MKVQVKRSTNGVIYILIPLMFIIKLYAKDIYEALKEMESVYRRLPKEEQIIMRNKIQSIINNYRKE